MRTEQITLSEWDSALPADGFEVFHLPEALRVVDRHTDAEMKLFGGFKGQQPIALLPVFVRRTSVGGVVTSPPPGVGIPRLGPILMPTSPKRRKREKVNNEFTESVLQRFDDEFDADERLAAVGFDSPLAETVIDRLNVDSWPILFRMKANADYGDPRPYMWDDLEVELGFTYLLDLENRSAEAVRESFSERYRRQLREAESSDVTVEIEGLAGAREVFRAAAEHHADRGRSFPPSWSYVRDLFEALAEEDRARAYVARDESGRYHSGVTVLYSNDRAYSWQGDARVVSDESELDGLVHWRVIEDLVEDPPVESVTKYDLLDADVEDLCRHEVRFGAGLDSYYVVESPGVAMNVAKQAYQLVR